MTAPQQRTIAGEVTLEGVGVHSGEEARLTLRPANPGHGITFRRADLDDDPLVPADLDHVVGTELGTTLGHDDAEVRTVEHVLAALAGAQVDNVAIDATLVPEPGATLMLVAGLAGLTVAGGRRSEGEGALRVSA